MKEIDFKGVVQYKTYPRFEKIVNNTILKETPMTNLIRNRRTRREPSDDRIHIDLLHPILNLAAGRTGDEDFRGYPSAGARYPLELYLAAFDIEGLDAGIYHFSPFDGSLEKLWMGDFKIKISEALNGAIDDFEEKAKGFLIITSIEKRTTFKYGDGGKAFPYIEVGYMGANIILLLEEVDINTVIIGIQWSKRKLGNLLDINLTNEEVISGIAML